MNATELRIGNWVMGNNPFQIEANDIALGYYHEKNTCKLRWNPIHVTEEWLIKFGFKEHTCNDGVVGFKLGNYTWINEGQFRFISIFNEESTMLLEAEVIYVHTFQNLYFALTGKELTISE